MKVDYSKTLPWVISAMFPEAHEQEVATNLLNQYGVDKWHIEPERVKLAILKLAYDDKSNLAALVECACSDYRDVLFIAESPSSSMTLVSPEDDPETYKKLVSEDEEEYLNWLNEVAKV